jgi:hypothetical protein
MLERCEESYVNGVRTAKKFPSGRLSERATDAVGMSLPYLRGANGETSFVCCEMGLKVSS